MEGVGRFVGMAGGEVHEKECSAMRLSRLGHHIRLRRRGTRGKTLGAAAIAVLLPIAWITAHSSDEIPPAPGGDALRIVTYNIRAGLGGIKEISEDLRPLSADIIALQEVERGIYGSRKIDQASSLAEALGMKLAYARSFSLEGRDHGIAVLSRYPLSETETMPLPSASGRWPRVALKSRVDTPWGPVRFVCVHLTRPWRTPFSHTRERMAQLRTIFDSMKGDSLPQIMAGDFNSTPFSPERWFISQHLQDSWKPWRDGWALTFPLSSIGIPTGSVKIDAVYHQECWRSSGTWVPPQGASDHRPVVVDLLPKDSKSAELEDPARMRAS
jgi:endonuclease/exonuclease/phosphatase family metal-dependent hydrolase